jgi:hypothetical protein
VVIVTISASINQIKEYWREGEERNREERKKIPKRGFLYLTKS